jgi:hypothetical protein
MYTMLGLLAPRSPRPASRTRPLGLEALEDRNSPSTLILNIVAYGPGTSVTFSGALRGSDNPGGQTINFSGKVTGSTTTTPCGMYAITLKASGLGDVTAQTADGMSNVAVVTLTDTAPRITQFQAIEGTGHLWTFQGDVTYRYPQGLIVNLGGMPDSLQGKTAPVDSSGHFWVVLELNGTTSDNGTASAVTTDPWGLTSNTAYSNVFQTGT